MTSKSQQQPPLALKVVGFSIRFLTRLSPQLAASFVRYLWFKTHRSREPKREAQILKHAQWQQFHDGNGSVQVYIWGQENSPSILLVHGWNGRAAQLGMIAEKLVTLGYRVIGFDAPAHGRSAGSSTNLPAISHTIQQIDNKLGPFTAGIAHSFGCLCLVHALNEGLEMEKVVCIAPVTDVESLVEAFAEIVGIEPQVTQFQKRLLEQEFGEDMWQRFSIPNMANTMNIPGLIIHDDKDKEVPVRSGKRISEIWRSSQFMRTSGLGHRRILQDPKVIDKIRLFLEADNH